MKAMACKKCLGVLMERDGEAPVCVKCDVKEEVDVVVEKKRAVYEDEEEENDDDDDDALFDELEREAEVIQRKKVGSVRGPAAIPAKKPATPPMRRKAPNFSFEDKAKEKTAAEPTLATPSKSGKKSGLMQMAVEDTGIITAALSTVLNKIQMAAQDLELCADAARCGELAGTIKMLAEAATALKQAGGE